MKTNKLPIILTIIFIISLIPLYIIGGYAHPSVDDYYYGVETAGVYNDTHSIGSVIRESYSLMKDTYMQWQGNFAAIFLMRLQPAIFGESFYVIAPIILITSFVVAMILFFTTLLYKWFKADKRTSYIISLVITFCAMQFTYVPSDSFYWYNGSIYYTFFFSLMLVMFAAFTYMLKGHKMPLRIICGIASVILAFIIGGGNYATALFTSVILVVFSVYYLSKKEKISVPVILVMLASVAALFISMKAPGNAIRQESVGGSTGVITALAYSFTYGAYNIASSTTMPVLIMWTALLPVFYKISAYTRCNFRYPLAFLLFTFGIFCSQGTPVFYAQGLRMPYRMMNIIYFSYYIFMTINLIYLMGYIRRVFGHTAFVKNTMGIYEHRLTGRVAVISLSLMFCAGCVGLITVSEGEGGGASFSGMPMSLAASYSLVTHEASTYDSELNARSEYLSQTTEKDVSVAPLSITPQVIFHSDITTDASHWKNAHLALYYHKDFIRLTN